MSVVACCNRVKCMGLNCISNLSNVVERYYYIELSSNRG